MWICVHIDSYLIQYPNPFIRYPKSFYPVSKVLADIWTGVESKDWTRKEEIRPGRIIKLDNYEL